MQTKKDGHIAAGCKEQKLVFSYAGDSKDDEQVLQPYLD